MKKYLPLFSLLMFVMCFCFVGCNESQSVVRIHIRANSNFETDQGVKLLVRDAVVDFITPLIAGCDSSNDVKDVLSENLEEIENVADEVLISNGFLYASNAEVRNEFFPSRKYDDKLFPADYYDALIVELGSGEGDNWWCVAYPPLCFVGESAGCKSVRYQSKILELINKYFGG